MKNIRDIISFYEGIIIQIATPYSTGTGFYLKSYDLIVTNEHVVRDNKNAVIAGKGFTKQLVPVLYIDTLYDLAFLQAPLDHNMPAADTDSIDNLYEGNKVIAIGHPFDLKYTVTQGIISSMLHQEGDINYIQHDAALNPGNSGGPLVSTDGRIVGINTFIIQNGNSIGFSLPVSYLLACMDDFKAGKGAKGVRCASCKNVSFESLNKSTGYCQVCGSPLQMISQFNEYEPYGVCNTVEEIISRMGYSVALTRKGPNNWSIKKGSAIVNISYYEKTGMLVGDVFLCTLPENNIEDLYYYLLKKNYILEGLSISIKDQDIILSLLIFDQYINTETLYKLFNKLLHTSDDVDNQLIEQFKAKWKFNSG